MGVLYELHIFVVFMLYCINVENLFRIGLNWVKNLDN